jgi:tRNA U34 5-carboxymethylaminomethyl modifying enzyme MnmG/GidA
VPNSKQTFPQIAAASRISGVTPTAILRLLRVLKQENIGTEKAFGK